MSPGFPRWAPRPLERRWVPGWARDPVRASDVLGNVCWGFWERQADCPAVDSKVKAMPWRTGQRIGSMGTWPGCWIEPPLSRTCTWRAESSRIRQFESVFSLQHGYFLPEPTCSQWSSPPLLGLLLYREQKRHKYVCILPELVTRHVF